MTHRSQISPPVWPVKSAPHCGDSVPQRASHGHDPRAKRLGVRGGWLWIATGGREHLDHTLADTGQVSTHPDQDLSSSSSPSRINPSRMCSVPM